MQHRINLYFNDENPIDAKIWNILKDKKKRPDIIKAMLLGLIELEDKPSTIDSKTVEESSTDNDDDLSDMENDMDGVDL